MAEANNKQQQGIRIFIRKAGRILRYFKPYWVNWLGLFIIANFSTAISLVNPLIMKFLIDIVLVEKKFAYLHIIMGIFILIVLLGMFFRLYSNYYYTKLQLNILFDVRNDLFQHLENLDVSFFKEKKLGDIISRLTGDIGAIEEFVSLIFNTFIISVLTLIFIFIISASLHLRLTLLAMVVVPAIVLVQRYYGTRIREKYRIIREKGAEFLSYLQERLSFVPMIKLFTQEKTELYREEVKAKDVMRKNLDLTLTSSFASAATGIFISGSLIFTLWYGSYQVIIGALTIGSLVAIYSYIAQLFGPVGALTSLNVAMQTTMVSAERVFEFLDIKPKIMDKTGAKPLEEMEGEIRFQNVAFAYQVEEPILEGVNFVIKPGESIGLVGPSGVGKTTLVELITRFYDPTAGRILIDGMDLRDAQLQSLRSQIGMVTQEAILFNATLEENIAYGKASASFEEIAEAAKIAGIHDFIVTLPQGYETVVGERGLRLSQGQRQRIALARVFLKDPAIFLLDEATASLDSESEMRIQKAITEVMKGRTTIIIAHRLATIQAVDQIFVLNGKGVVEQGTFSELMDKKGHFYDLYMAQFGGFHAFREKLDYEMKRAREYQETMLLLGVSIENFDEIAERLGKERGEKALQNISNIICANIRDIDFLTPDARERNLFYIVMPKMKPYEEEELQKRLREKIPPEFVLRFAVAVSEVHGRSVEELMNWCRELLSAKRG
jgi:ABC-type multidrug transport system fused ATPase/permease subunit